jgi:D-alanyl-D-alanine carboxypeptidase
VPAYAGARSGADNSAAATDSVSAFANRRHTCRLGLLAREDCCAKAARRRNGWRSPFSHANRGVPALGATAIWAEQNFGVRRMLLSSQSNKLCCANATARAALTATLLLLLAACGQQGEAPYGGPGAVIGGVPSYAPMHYYPPPGPPDDPWGPYIREAAARYDVPEQWIRAVMQQESGGEEQAVSPVGAMGLMQVMPETYETLQERYGLGDDPFDPHNNILAGAAYIREMYDRFGSPGFLAGYNAGPDRVDAYLSGSEGLPDETINYLAAVTPNLGDDVQLSGPFAVYASARMGHRYGGGVSVASLAAGCDLDAAYDPSHPCSSLERVAVAAAPYQPTFVPQYGVGGCNMDVAYDPSHPCTSVGETAAAAAPPAPIQQAANASPSPQPTLSQPMVVASAAPPPAPAPAGPIGVDRTGGDGCNLDVAYDPNHPCTSAGQAPEQLAAASPAPGAAGAPQIASGCDPNIAFDPAAPCYEVSPDAFRSPPAAAPPSFAEYPPAPQPSRPILTDAAGGGDSHLLALPARDWGIQVGAFANPRLARAVAENARAQAPGQLRFAALALPPTPYRGAVLYRARLVHLSASAASDACWELTQRQLPCVVVQPNRT